MKRLLTMLACLTCTILSTSLSGVNPIKESLSSITQFKQDVRFEFQEQNLVFAKGSGGSRGGASRSAPKGGHIKNVRESNRGKHEKADGRRQREQAKAEEKRENSKKK